MARRNRITIPINVYLVTLVVAENRVVTKKIQVGSKHETRRVRTEVVLKKVTPASDAAAVRKYVAVVNRLWRPAGVTFSLRSISPLETKALARAVSVTASDFRKLAHEILRDAAKKRAASRREVTVLIVNKLQTSGEKGYADDKLRTCMIGKMPNPDMAGTMLAHEFGHLLGLKKHADQGIKQLAGNTAQWMRARTNLMFSAPAIPGKGALTTPQITRARSSVLGRAWGGP